MARFVDFAKSFQKHGRHTVLAGVGYPGRREKVTTQGVKTLWKTDGENHRIYVLFCDSWVPLGVHFGDQGQHKTQNKGVFLVTFSGVGSGRVLGCFLDAFWMLFGSFLGGFGTEAAGIAG